MVMGERMRAQERERVEGGTNSENSATDNRDNYCTQTEEMMDQTRYHFGAPLSSFTYLFFSSLFLSSLYYLPITTPSERFPLPTPSYRNTFRVYFAF